MGYGFGAPGLPQQHHPGQPGLAPSALPRNFTAGSGPPFDQSFNRGPPVSPIGPPPKAKPSSLSSSPSAPTILSLVPGQGRRGSLLLTGDPGPIGRPVLAPIARPSVSGPSNGTGEGSSGPGSPIRRSPSPKGVLGSSALVEDGDEVVKVPTSRRSGTAPMPIGTGVNMGIGPIGPGGGWGPASPRSAVGGDRAPWGAPPGFPRGPIGPPPPVGPLNNQHLPHSPIQGLWGSAGSGSGAQEWHPPPGGYFGPNTGQYAGLNTASPPPNNSN